MAIACPRGQMHAAAGFRSGAGLAILVLMRHDSPLNTPSFSDRPAASVYGEGEACIMSLQAAQGLNVHTTRELPTKAVSHKPQHHGSLEGPLHP